MGPAIELLRCLKKRLVIRLLAPFRRLRALFWLGALRLQQLDTSDRRPQRPQLIKMLVYHDRQIPCLASCAWNGWPAYIWPYDVLISRKKKHRSTPNRTVGPIFISKYEIQHVVSIFWFCSFGKGNVFCFCDAPQYFTSGEIVGECGVTLKGKVPKTFKDKIEIGLPELTK